MDATSFFTTISLILATILLIFGMKYLSAARQTRLGTASETSLRALVERAAAAQAAMTASLTAALADLADVKTRLSAIETMLRDVG